MNPLSRAATWIDDAVTPQLFADVGSVDRIDLRWKTKQAVVVPVVYVRDNIIVGIGESGPEAVGSEPRHVLRSRDAELLAKLLSHWWRQLWGWNTSLRPALWVSLHRDIDNEEMRALWQDAAKRALMYPRWRSERL